MARILNYTFPISNVHDVCLLQPSQDVGNFILNGTLSNSTNSEVSFISHGYSRQISITSEKDFSGSTFTITGSQNGVEFSEDMAGPNATTVYSVQIYDVITSISVVNGQVDAMVSVGTGDFGFFPLIGINLDRPIINYGLSLAAINIANPFIGTTVYSTLDNISQNGTTFLGTLLNPSLFTVKAGSQELLYILPPANMVICRSILIALNAVNPGESLLNGTSMNFIQI